MDLYMFKATTIYFYKQIYYSFSFYFKNTPKKSCSLNKKEINIGYI